MRWLSTSAANKACFRLLARAAAGGKNRSFRAAPNMRAHTGPRICLDVKNIWGWDILVRVMDERDERDCVYPDCMVIHGGQWCCDHSWCTDTWRNTIALRERVERSEIWAGMPWRID